MPRFVHAPSRARAHNRSAIPGEFIDPPQPTVLNGLRRGVGLASDLSLLLLFSPFFGIWFLYRGILHLKRRAVRPKT